MHAPRRVVGFSRLAFGFWLLDFWTGCIIRPTEDELAIVFFFSILIPTRSAIPSSFLESTSSCLHIRVGFNLCQLGVGSDPPYITDTRCRRYVRKERQGHELSLQ